MHEDVSTTGERLPVTVSHVYNFRESETGSRFGNGWRLNVMQQLEETGDANYLINTPMQTALRIIFIRMRVMAIN